MVKTKTNRDDIIESTEKNLNHAISHEFAELAYEFTDDDGKAFFKYRSKDGAKHKVGFSLMKYKPSDGTDDYPNTKNHPSGAYVFKPMRSDTSKHPYSAYKSIESFKGKVVEAMVL